MMTIICFQHYVSQPLSQNAWLFGFKVFQSLAKPSDWRLWLMFLKAHGPRSPSSGCGVYRRCSSLEPGEWLAPDEWLTSPSVSWSQRSQRMFEMVWICLLKFVEYVWIINIFWITFRIMTSRHLKMHKGIGTVVRCQSCLIGCMFRIQTCLMYIASRTDTSQYS